MLARRRVCGTIMVVSLQWNAIYLTKFFVSILVHGYPLNSPKFKVEKIERDRHKEILALVHLRNTAANVRQTLSICSIFTALV